MMINIVVLRASRRTHSASRQTQRRATISSSPWSWRDKQISGRPMTPVLIVCVLLASMATAQSTASLRGTISDSTDRTIAGAAVLLQQTDSATRRIVLTGREGQYQFLLIPPGTYSLRITAPGFAAYEQTGLQLLVNTPTTLNVQLKPAGPKETITVEGGSSAIDSVDASIGNTFAGNRIKELPLEGRNVPDLLSLQPGAVYIGDRPDIDVTIDTRNGAIDGARSDQSNITLDGVDVNNQATGAGFTSVLPVTLDSIQEFRVSTTNYNSDQGSGSGAQLALITRSGTNQFHGSAYEYLRNTLTSANDWFVKRSEIATGLPNVPDKLNRNIFGVALGGPVKKDRLFAFVNYEGIRESEDQSTVRSVPTATLREGILEYPNVNGSITTLSAQDITALDPLHLGPNPVMLSYFNTYAVPNDFNVGDGLNFAGYRFRAPIRLNNDAFVARLDYRIDTAAKNTLFWRGALQNLANPQAPFLPGTPPEQTLLDHSKGFVLGVTSVLKSTLVNTFHWGFTRQSQGVLGNTDGPWNTFPGLDQGIDYGHNFQIPMHNILDDLSWSKGTHSLQFGINAGFVRNASSSLVKSFSASTAALGGANPTGFANQASPLNPTNGGFPAVNPLFNNTYDTPMAALLGIQVTVSAVYNYDKQGNVLAQGTPIGRKFGLNWYEIYGQDSWRIKRNLTLTYGLRWSLLPPPWALNGVQVAPNVGLGTLFNQNVANMQKGIGYEADPIISYVLGGKANGRPGIYHFRKHDVAPRIAIAYSPRSTKVWLRKLIGEGDQTVIRGGIGRVYDRPGMQLINSFDQQGSFGLTTTLMNPCCLDGAAQLPRITDLNVLPKVDRVGNVFYLPAPKGGFPLTPSTTGEASGWGIDDTLKTPNSYTFDFAITRALPKKMSVQIAYVGRLGRNLLTMRDLMPQLNVTDPKTRIDYFSAAARLSQLVRAGTPTANITNSLVGATGAYWQNMVQPLKAGGAYNLFCSGGSTTNVIQAVYDLYACEPYVEVLGLALINYYGALTDAKIPAQTYYFNNGPFSFQNGQFANMFAWSSIGTANYNALQITVAKQFGSRVHFDANYTYSKSIDLTSSAARVGFGGSTYFDGGLIGDALVNQFQPNQMRAVSDFDLTHQISADWVAELPFGRGTLFGRNVGHAVNSVISGWRLSGLVRFTSGFPISVDNGFAWATEWANEGPAQMLRHPATGAYRQADGSVNLFANPAGAIQDFVRPLPGGSGSRNVIRGAGFAGLDLGLAKVWRLPRERQTLQFRWEVFNVPNLVRFNVQASPPSLLETGSFGAYTGLLTQPRTMQFALRYEF
jgi:hypothetical protein